MAVLTGKSGTDKSGRAFDEIDLSSRAFWSTTAAERERLFAVLRAERPVSWHPPVEDSLMPDPTDPGFWALTRRSDIVAVSRNNDAFRSGQGVMFESIPVELLEASQRANAGTGMDGADPARMAGAPGFKEVESFGPAHLADRDAIRAQA